MGTKEKVIDRIGDINKHRDIIKQFNLDNKSFVWCGKTLYTNDLL